MRNLQIEMIYILIYICYTYIQAKSEQCTIWFLQRMKYYPVIQRLKSKQTKIFRDVWHLDLCLSRYIVYYKEQTLESMANLPQVVNPNLHEDFLNLLQELHGITTFIVVSPKKHPLKDCRKGHLSLKEKNIWNLSENRTLWIQAAARNALRVQFGG